MQIRYIFMPTAPKPAPAAAARQLTLGLFRWLRKHCHTRAPTAVAAKPALKAALLANELTDPAKTIATAFLQALDTLLHLTLPELHDKDRRRRAPKTVAAIAHLTEDAELRAKALPLLQRFHAEEFTSLIEQIAEVAAKRAALEGATPAGQDRVRTRWVDDARLLEALVHGLEERLRAPLGIVFPQTLRDWNNFERKLVDDLTGLGFSYRDIARLRSAGKGDDDARERIRGSARRARVGKKSPKPRSKK